MVHLVTYHLHDRTMFNVFAPAPNYAGVEQAVRDISGTWMHLGGGRWFVESEMSTQQIADRIAPLTYQGDQIFVIRVQRDYHGYGLTPEQVNWLQARNYSSIWDVVKALAPLPIPKPVENSLQNALKGLLRG